MALLTDLALEVYSLTGRPDLVAETIFELRNSTLRVHRSDNYYRDLSESAVTFAGPAFQQSFDYKSAFPKWRSLKYLRHYDQVTQLPGRFLTIIEPMEALNQYGNTRVDVAYPAGLVFQIRAQQQFDTLLVGYYQDPIVSLVGYSSWISDEHPFLLVWMTAASIFKMIGQDESVNRAEAMAATLMHDLKATNISPVGY